MPANDTPQCEPYSGLQDRNPVLDGYDKSALPGEGTRLACRDRFGPASGLTID